MAWSVIRHPVESASGQFFNGGALYQTDVVLTIHQDEEEAENYDPYRKVSDVHMTSFRCDTSVGIALDKTLNVFASELDSHYSTFDLGASISHMDCLPDGSLAVCATRDARLHFLSVGERSELVHSQKLTGSVAAVKLVASTPDQDVFDLWLWLDDGLLTCSRMLDLRDGVSKESLANVYRQMVNVCIDLPWIGIAGSLRPVSMEDGDYLMCVSIGNTLAVSQWIGDDPDSTDFHLCCTETDALRRMEPLSDQQTILATDARGDLLLFDVSVLLVLDRCCGLQVQDFALLETQYKVGDAAARDLVALLMRPKAGRPLLEVRALPELEETIFSMEVDDGPLCLLPISSDKGPLAFLSPSSEDQRCVQLTLVAEVHPEQKLLRLLAKGRFEEADLLAATFNLDTQVILVHKIAHFLDRVDETVLDSLFECLEGIQGLASHPHLVMACLRTVMPRADAQSRLLRVLIQKLHDCLDEASGEDAAKIEAAIEKAADFLSRLKTFLALMPSQDYTVMSWSRFAYTDLYNEFFKALTSTNLSNAFLLWNNHRRVIQDRFVGFGEQAVLDLLSVVTACYRLSPSLVAWLGAEILPFVVRRLDSACLTSFVNHFHRVVEDLDDESGIRVISQLLGAARQDSLFACKSPMDEAVLLVSQVGCGNDLDPLFPLRQLLAQLEKVKTMRERYNFRLSLRELAGLDSTRIAYRMLDRELNLDNLSQAMDARIRAYLKDEGIAEAAFLGGYIDDLLGQMENADEVKRVSQLEVRVCSVLRFLPPTASRLSALLRLAKTARLPWSDAVWSPVHDALAPAPDLSSASQHPCMAALDREAKTATLHALLARRGVVLSGPVCRSSGRRVIRRIVHVHVEKGEIDEEVLTDLDNIGMEAGFSRLEVRRFVVWEFVRRRRPLDLLSFVETQPAAERGPLLTSAFRVSAELCGPGQEDVALALGARLLREGEDEDVRKRMDGLRAIQFLRERFQVEATPEMVADAGWAAAFFTDRLREELQSRSPRPPPHSFSSSMSARSSVVVEEEAPPSPLPSPRLRRLALLLTAAGCPGLSPLPPLWVEAALREWPVERALITVLAALRQEAVGDWAWSVMRRLVDAVARMDQEKQQRVMPGLVEWVKRCEASIQQRFLKNRASVTAALQVVQTLHAVNKERTSRTLAPRVDVFSAWRFSVQFHESSSTSPSILHALLHRAWSWCQALAADDAHSHVQETAALAEDLMAAGLLLSGTCVLVSQLSSLLWSVGHRDEVVDRLSADLLDTRLGMLLERLLTSRCIDAKLVLYLVCSLRPPLATRALTRGIRKVPNSYKVAQMVADIAHAFGGALGNAKSREMGRRLDRVALWVKKCSGVAGDWGAILHADKYSQGLGVLFDSEVDAETLRNYCADFHLPRESALKKFLRAKLTWTAPDSGEVDQEFVQMVEARLSAAQDAFELLRAEKDSGVTGANNGCLHELLSELVAESDPFDHERIRFLLTNAVEVAEEGKVGEMKRQLEMVDFLMTWRRVGNPSREETEWLAHRTDQEEPLLFRESLLLSPFSRTRLPFHAMLDKAQLIIEPEITAENVDRLETHAHLLGMSTDALHMVAVNNLVRARASWFRQNPTSVSSAVLWRGVGSEVDEALWQQFSRLLDHIGRPKSALTCAQVMASATPSGWERLRALDLCVDLATRWVEGAVVGSQERQLADRALTKFANHRRSLGLEGILHRHGLNGKDTLALIRQPEALLLHLLESHSEASPSLSAAVSVATQTGQQIAFEAWQLLSKWLGRSQEAEAAGLEMTFSVGDWTEAAVSSSERWVSVDEDEDLQRAVSLLRHKEVCPSALSQVGGLAFGREESTVCRLRSLACLLHAAPAHTVREMAGRHYREQLEAGETSGPPPTLVQYTGALIFASRVDELSSCSVEDVLIGDRTELARRLLRDRRVLGDVHGLAVTAHLLMDFNINEAQLWAFLISRLNNARVSGSFKTVISVSALSHALTALPAAVQLSLLRAPDLPSCLSGAGVGAGVGLARRLGACPLLLLLLTHLPLSSIVETWSPRAKAVLLRQLPPDCPEREIFQSDVEGHETDTDCLGFTGEENEATSS